MINTEIPREAVLLVVGRGGGGGKEGSESYIFGSEIFNGIYIVGCEFFHQTLYFSS